MGRDGDEERPGALVELEGSGVGEGSEWAAELRLRAVLDNASVAIFFMDERQHCVFMNRAAEELTGYRFDEVQGRPLHEFVHYKKPDGSPYPIEECPIDRAFPERARMQGEELFVHRDGSFYPVAFTASPIRNPDMQTIGTIIEVRGTAEEKAAERALRESEQLLRTIGEYSADLIYAKDRDGRLLYGNPATFSVIGRPPSEVIGRNEIEWHTDREQAEEILANDLAVMKSGQVQRVEERFTTPGGEPQTFLSTKAPMRNADGDVVGLVGVSTDISSLKAQEKQLREVGEMREALLHEVNHRVKNSLQLIVSMLSIQARQVSDEQARALLHDAIARVGVVATLHQQLYSSGGHDRIDFMDFARELAEATVASLADPGRVALDFLGEGTAVLTVERAVPAALIIAELLTNAVKYGCAEGERRVAVRLRVVGESLELEIADDGPGLPAGLDPAESDGLGLKIVNALCRQLGCRLTYRDAKPGAAFGITIPLDQENETPDPA